MAVTDDDKLHITTLLGKLPEKPQYGSSGYYTVAAGGWSLSERPNELINIHSAVSGNAVGHLPGWAVTASEASARKDAEMHLALDYNDEFTEQAPRENLSKGTLYIVVDKGPCRSCRNVLKTLRKYWGFRLVVFYMGHQTVGGRVGQMGYGDSIEYNNGHVKEFDFE